MLEYQAPLRDLDFVLRELLESETHYASLAGCERLDGELLDALLQGAARFSEEVVAPLLRTSDEQGCRFEDGTVHTPEGFAETFRLYGEGGWQALTAPTAEGGQGLPPSTGFVVSEIIGSGCWAWSMYSGLALAPVTCLLNGGTPEQKQTFLPKILSGEWAGTMCLTEAHCGSDVGLLRTKAKRRDDGTYEISGTKIFVSGGEQDMTENIVHSLLARVEGAPAGTKGVSLFIVPKFLVKADGSLGERNAVSCSSIEKKMGLKGSATCVMNFDGATGYLVGTENRGLEVMFKLMNTARLGTAVQGLALGEVAFQGALAYARERLQMRSLTGPKNPTQEADPIVVHPDIRRMLLTQKAIVEGQRAFIGWLAQRVDLAAHGDEAAKQEAEDRLEFLTPVAKAFCTETSQEVTSLGIQIFGGHGYIADNGMEQIARDGRISTVYEGTTGIQALDLIGRKVLATGGRLLRVVTSDIGAWCDARLGNADLEPFVGPLALANEHWETMTTTLCDRAIENLDELGAASVDYALYSGYVVVGWMWARMAELAGRRLEEIASGGVGEAAFYRAKIVTAHFYYERLLPRTTSHAAAALAGAATLMELDEETFAF